jgi:hypothetical protein
MEKEKVPLFFPFSDFFSSLFSVHAYTVRWSKRGNEHQILMTHEISTLES